VPPGSGAAADGRRLSAESVIRWLAAAIVVLVGLAGLSMLAVHVFAPQRSGPLVFSEIFEPFLLLGLVVGALLFAFVARRRVATILLLTLVVAAALRYGPLLMSFPAAAPAGAQRLHLMTWNLEAGEVAVDTMTDAIDDSRPDIVALVELVPRVSRALEVDERLLAQYPYQALLPRSGAPDLGLLSRFPIIEQEFSQEPNMLRAVIAPSDGPPITVFVAHPYLASIDQIGFVPDIQTRSRDRQISQIRARIDADLAAGNDILVMGDFNVTEREPAYAELSAGLHDAQREAGYGLGLTWRPERLEHLPFGLLRIDYLFGSPDFVAIAAGPDCTPRGSDHCLLSATFARPQTRPASASGRLQGPAGPVARALAARAVAVAPR
jgi:endonuclease/exonuclease/phosphatase family metal-dependent hydrolase